MIYKRQSVKDITSLAVFSTCDAYGEELLDPYNESWPMHLSKLMNIDIPYNISFNRISNDNIFFNVSYFINKYKKDNKNLKNLLIFISLIGATKSLFFSIINSTDQYELVSVCKVREDKGNIYCKSMPINDLIRSKRNTHIIDVDYIKNTKKSIKDESMLEKVIDYKFDNIDNILYEQVLNLYKLISFLEFNSINYRITGVYHRDKLLFNINRSNFEKRIAMQILNNPNCFLKESDILFNDYIIDELKIPLLPNGHASAEAHKIYAQYIYDNYL